MPTHTVASFTLPGASMGNTRTLAIHRYGDRSTPVKAYLQAGLHADEAPGFLVMHHLMDRLDRLDTENAITGDIVLVPVANPIGVSQWRDDWLQGRFDFWNGVNFNRSYPDLAAQVAEQVKNDLGDFAEDNIRIIREAAGRVIGTLTAEEEAGHLKHKLLSLAYDADIVLDLHCDYQAVLHVYMGESLWPRDRDLSAQLGAQATLLADDSGVTPFDEACSRFWFELASRFPRTPHPAGLPGRHRGTARPGRSDPRNGRAGRRQYRHLPHPAGPDPGETPELPALPRDATPLSGVEHIKAPCPGVVVFYKAAGDKVLAGDVVAEVINPLAGTSNERVHPIKATTDGIVFARSVDRFARPGRILAKIAGRKPLKPAGANLLTA